MDLYEAIEVVEAYLNDCEAAAGIYRPDDREIEAFKICLEAAKDKAGV